MISIIKMAARFGLRYGLRYGKKAVLFAEIALESFHLGHKSKHNKPAHEHKHLTYISSESVFEKMKSQIVHLFDEEYNFLGAGVVFNDILISHKAPKTDLGSKVLARTINADEDTKDNVAKLLMNLDDDNIYIYRLDSSLNNFKDNYNPAPLEKGEQILLFSPIQADEYALRDAYVVDVNHADDLSNYIYQSTSLLKNNSELSNIVYDFQGNFQGIIPPKNKKIIPADYLFGIVDQCSKNKELKHAALPFETQDAFGKDGKNTGVTITKFLVFEPKGVEKYTGWMIVEVNDIPVTNTSELHKIVGYDVNRKFNFTLHNDKGEIERFEMKAF